MPAKKNSADFLPSESGVVICVDPPKDGNCQFAAVAYLLRHDVQATLSHDDIRADVVRFLRDDNPVLLDGTPYIFEPHVVAEHKTKNNYLTKMSRIGTYGDHITLVAMSCIYKVQFIVLSTLGENATRVISPTMHSCHIDSFPTLLLGHYAEDEGTHYVGLLPDGMNTVTDIIQKFCPPSSFVHPCLGNVTHSDAATTDQEISSSDLGHKAVGPKQPHLTSFPKTVFGQRNRSFSSTYYENYPWLEYSVDRDAVFCFACRHFHTDRRFVEELFIAKGLKDWKKLSEKLAKHASSQAHVGHMQKWRGFQATCKTGSVAMQISEAHGAEVHKNRQYVATACDVIKLLAKLGLPFRGHDERKGSVSRGNFLEVCDFLSNYVESFKGMQDAYFNCTSPEFQNEMITICGKAVHSAIVDAVRKVGFFTVMADEARSAKTEQLSLCVRYADGLSVKERFMSFVDCSNSRDAESITKLIKDTLSSLKLQEVPIVGQSYDGAAVMAGHVSGVQERIRADNPSALYFHCMAHKLNLVLVNTCRVNRTAVAFFSVIEQLYKFFANPGHHQNFLKVQNALGMKAREIGQLSDTRWACRWKSVDAVKTNYAAIIDSLAELSDPVESFSAEAAGLGQHMKTAQFVVALVVFEEFLRIIHVAHNALQGANITLAKAGDTVERLKMSISRKRTHKSFVGLYRHAEALGKLHGINIPSLPQTVDAETCDSTSLSASPNTTIRHKRPVKASSSLRDYLTTTTLGQREHVDVSSGDSNADTGLQQEPTLSPFYRQLYLCVCDTLIGELEFRFNEDSLKTARAVDAVLQCDKDEIRPLVHQYAAILNINPQLLAAEMELFSGTNNKITMEVIQKELTHDAYPQYYRMVQLALTLPVGTATAERSFSAMRRIRNWLRSTMAEERFSYLALLNIESDLTAALDPEDLVQLYACSGKRRIKLQ